MVIKKLIYENIDKLKQIQEKLLEYLEDEEADESSESKLIKYLVTSMILKNSCI